MQIRRKFPGRSDAEIFDRVHDVMSHLAERFSLDYRRDEALRTGSVSKAGVTGTYQVRGEEVVVDLRFPMLLPGSWRRKVEEDIERKLDTLFS
ncbi:MAG TPA: polyhydroxyalkanoic acid system family protein [Anaeromyxobacteraceae bacterium]|nr:polyhydroxyalkanoic acid system family protein [Anaeromyxobacteraceae bacterium]